MWRAKRSRQFLNGVMQKVSRYPDYPQRPTKPFSLRSVMAPMVPPISLSPPSISADTMPPVVQVRSELRCAACLLSTPHLHRGVIYPEVWSLQQPTVQLATLQKLTARGCLIAGFILDLPWHLQDRSHSDAAWRVARVRAVNVRLTWRWLIRCRTAVSLRYGAFFCLECLRNVERPARNLPRRQCIACSEQTNHCRNRESLNVFVLFACHFFAPVDFPTISTTSSSDTRIRSPTIEKMRLAESTNTTPPASPKAAQRRTLLLSEPSTVTGNL